MFGQSLSQPAILSFFSANYDDEVVPSRIVGMEKIRDKAHQAQTTGEDDELIFCTELLEEVLLVLLQWQLK